MSPAPACPDLDQPCEHSGPREACGVIGVFGVPRAAEQVYLGLYALQHRGQESAGIVASDGVGIQSQKGLGLLSEAIQPEDLRELPGHIAIGHVRYSTTGAKRVQNIQPLVIEYSQGIVAVGHNGNLTNAQALRHYYEGKGSIFQTSTDSEVFVHLMADPDNLHAPNPLKAVMNRVRGSYSLVMLTTHELTAARDPYGFRPLSLGRLGSGYVVASETCALDLLGATLIRDVNPGEIITVNRRGLQSVAFADSPRQAHCIFEYIYFARPDSIIFGHTVHNVRLRLGENLAASAPADADIVVPVPDSGNSAAMGYSRRSGIPLDMGFVRNHYIGRTFITPAAEERAGDVRIKLNAVRDVVRGKRLVVIDDSIVRGTTCKARVASLREAGAKEIHLRISAPPVRRPCYYGIDFQHADELIAADHSIEEIAEFVGADSLGYQTIEGLIAAVPGAGGGLLLRLLHRRIPRRDQRNHVQALPGDTSVGSGGPVSVDKPECAAYYAARARTGNQCAGGRRNEPKSQGGPRPDRSLLPQVEGQGVGRLRVGSPARLRSRQRRGRPRGP